MRVILELGVVELPRELVDLLLGLVRVLALSWHGRRVWDLGVFCGKVHGGLLVTNVVVGVGSHGDQLVYGDIGGGIWASELIGAHIDELRKLSGRIGRGRSHSSQGKGRR